MAGCAGGPTTSAIGWDMVVISDSVLEIGGSVGVAADYASWIEKDLGVDVRVRSFFFGGATSGYVLEKLRSDTSLRDAVAAADVILFAVPMGEAKELCPWNAAAYKPAPGSLAEYEACASKFAASYGADAEAIVGEIVSLRSPADALIRAIDMYQLFYPAYQAMGLGPVIHDMWVELNAGLTHAAAAYGIPVAKVYATIMGPDGTTDPVAAGDVQREQLHLTKQGVAKVALLLRALGYEKTGASPTP